MNINKNELEKYRDKFIIVGVPNYKHPDKTWFNNGILTDLDEESILLINNNERIVIPYSQIRYIKHSGSSEAQNND